MKKVLFSFVVLISVLAVSCKKDNDLQPETPGAVAVKSINVQYKIVSESANVEASYLYPNADGKLEMRSETITRGDYSIDFKSTKGNFFSVEAHNVNAARKAVYVQIYIDGVLFQEGSSNSPSQQAVASGNY
jgi:hypothetical protein